jgi:capsular exopolysaccharide synthesis family protein
MTQHDRQDDRNLRWYLRAIKRRKDVVLLAMVVVPAAALIVSARQVPVHEATSRVLLKQSAAEGLSPGSREMPGPSSREVRTQAQVAHTPAIARRVLGALSLDGRSAVDLLDDVRVIADPDGGILEFEVRDRSGRTGVTIANEYARQYSLYRRRLEARPIEQALAGLRRQLAELGVGGPGNPAAIFRQADRLRTQQTILRAEAAVVDPATSAPQVRPQTARNGLVGLVFGTLFGLGVALFWAAVDTRPRSSTELRDALHLPLLARIPAHRRRFGPGSLPVMLAEPQSGEAEAFRVLRARLELANRMRRARSIMVTSAHRGEGRSSVAANLAVALARAGRHVVLVDLDLARPSLARVFRLVSGAGLTDVALGAPLEEAIVTIRVDGPHPNGRHGDGGANGGSLGVLTTGPAPPDVRDFRATETFSSVLTDLSHTGDFVIFDAPPLLALPDAAVLSGQVEAILLVARSSRLTRSALAELNTALAACSAPTLGFVLTDVVRDEDWKGRDRRSRWPAMR